MRERFHSEVGALQRIASSRGSKLLRLASVCGRVAVSAARTGAQATAAWIASRYDRPLREDIVFAVLAGTAGAIAGLLITFAAR
jgi:hypothetical protein